MVKSEKERMPHSQYLLSPSSQGVGVGGFNVPMLCETFLVTLNLALSHLMPMWVKTGGSEKSKPLMLQKQKARPRDSLWKSLYAPPTSVIASVQWDWGYNGYKGPTALTSVVSPVQWGWGYDGYKRPIAPGWEVFPPFKARKGQPERSSGKTLPEGPAMDAGTHRRALRARKHWQGSEGVCSRLGGKRRCTWQGCRWGWRRGWKRWPTHS